MKWSSEIISYEHMRNYDNTMTHLCFGKERNVLFAGHIRLQEEWLDVVVLVILVISFSIPILCTHGLELSHSYATCDL